MIDSKTREKINKKFRQLNQKFNPGLDWRETLIGEEDDLKLFLFTRPDMNDLQEYLQNKIVDWSFAQESLEKKDVRWKLASKRITVFELLIGFTDSLVADEKA